MRFLHFLLPKIILLGPWAYVIIFLAAVLESTAVVGLFFPGSTLVVFVGFLASQNIFNPVDVIILVTLGGITGDAISFYLGQRGTNLFRGESKLLKRSHLLAGEEFFKRHGDKSIVLARFIGPLRPIIPFVAGLFKMPDGKFFLFNVISGVAAAIFYVLVGYFFGAAWTKFSHLIGRVGLGAIVLIIVVLFIGHLNRQSFVKK